MDGIQQVSRITRMQSRMQGMTESILATNRKLKFEAPLLWVCDDGLRPSHFYLFTDWLLWGTLKEKTKRRDTAVAEKPSDKPPSDDEALLYRGKIPIQVRIVRCAVLIATVMLIMCAAVYELANTETKPERYGGQGDSRYGERQERILGNFRRHYGVGRDRDGEREERVADAAAQRYPAPWRRWT